MTYILATSIADTSSESIITKKDLQEGKYSNILDIFQFLAKNALDANGKPMESKIREISSSMAVNGQHAAVLSSVLLATLQRDLIGQLSNYDVEIYFNPSQKTIRSIVENGDKKCITFSAQKRLLNGEYVYDGEIVSGSGSGRIVYSVIDILNANFGFGDVKNKRKSKVSGILQRHKNNRVNKKEKIVKTQKYQEASGKIKDLLDDDFSDDEDELFDEKINPAFNLPKQLNLLSKSEHIYENVAGSEKNDIFSSVLN